MTMHPRVCLHQVVFARESVFAFMEHCREIGVANMTLATPLLPSGPEGLAAMRRALGDDGPKVAVINHPFALHPDLDRDDGATTRLAKAIDLAADLGADAMYLQTGGRGTLPWAEAADRFALLLQPALAIARRRGVRLMIENASPFNVDIHIAHTLHDTILLAERAGIGVCIDLQPCWGEAELPQLFRKAMPITGLVQVSDYVLGDRTAPCRAVPGDGAVPLELLIADLLDAGYPDLFDLELVGMRIDAEGGAAASLRAATWLSALLHRLGA